MNPSPKQKISTLVVAQGIIWIGLTIATTIVLAQSPNFGTILTILFPSAFISLAILAYEPRADPRDLDS